MGFEPLVHFQDRDFFSKFKVFSRICGTHESTVSSRAESSQRVLQNASRGV